MDEAVLERFLLDIVSRMRAEPDKGQVATYIPELAQVDPEQFAISLCLSNGKQFNFGDWQEKFSIQSVSKVFALAIALGRHGDRLWKRVRKEPSGNAFNSIVQLETEKGIPRNPFINAGAIVTTDSILTGNTPRETLGEILSFVRLASADEDIFINESVARSENETGNRNRSLIYFMKSEGNIENECDLTLGTYFHQCAIEMNAAQLARAGRFLAGFHTHNLINPRRVKSINSLMMTCGHYDGSGEFAYRVGIPGKSGVGGAILAVVPGIASVAVWSPGLDKYGNSLLATKALAELSYKFDWSVFG